MIMHSGKAHVFACKVKGNGINKKKKQQAQLSTAAWQEGQ